jgi:stage III sporulation protein AH
MKPMRTFAAALGRLRALDSRALAVLLASLLVALFSLYMLIASGGRDDSASQAASRVYEPVDSIARFRDERSRIRDTEVAQLNALIGDESAGQDIRDRAREKLLQLTEWMEEETTVEGVLRARGFTDPLVTVHADSVNVLVRQETLSQADAARILELAARETNQTGGNIKIIPIQ